MTVCAYGHRVQSPFSPVPSQVGPSQPSSPDRCNLSHESVALSRVPHSHTLETRDAVFPEVHLTLRRSWQPVCAWLSCGAKQAFAHLVRMRW